MGRALGINTTMAGLVEPAYGTTPGSGGYKLAVISSNLGEEQPLIEDDQLGFGREWLDHTYDVISNDGMRRWLAARGAREALIVPLPSPYHSGVIVVTALKWRWKLAALMRASAARSATRSGSA